MLSANCNRTRIVALRNRCAWVSASIYWDALRTRATRFLMPTEGRSRAFYLGKACFPNGTLRRGNFSTLHRRRPQAMTLIIASVDCRSLSLHGSPPRCDGYLGQHFRPLRTNGRILLSARGATVAARDANFEEVLRLYNRALQHDDRHPGALLD